MSEIEVTGKKIEWWKLILFHGSFAFMFVMAVVFFKERLYADSSYYLYKAIDTGFFVMPHQRIVLAISEIVPLIFFYLGSSLKTILISWSVGHVLFYYVLLLIALYKFKSEEGAIVIILLQVIGQTWLYFSPMLEICYGASLLIIFKLLLDTKTFNKANWFWLIVLEVLVLTSHPENFVVFFFVTGYDILKNRFRKRSHLIMLVLFVVLVIFKFLTFSDYEGGKIHYMTDLDHNHQYENLFKMDYLLDILKIFWQHYFDLVFLFVVAILYLNYRKSFKLLGLTIATLIGLIALINATNYAREFSRYNESLYYPLVTIIVIVFVFEILPSWSLNFKRVFFIVFIFIFIVRFQLITKQGEYLSYRLFQLEEVINIAHQNKVTKCLINMENGEKERWALNWSYPMESMLLSSLKSFDSTVSIITDEDMIERDTTVLLTPGKIMTRRWDIQDRTKMLSFFNFKNENYKPVNTKDSITDPYVFMGKIKLEINTQKVLHAYERIYTIIKIENLSDHLLTSLPLNQCYFQISCSTTENKFESTIPMDLDILTNYSQVISCPFPSSTKETDIKIKLIWMEKEVASREEKLTLN